MEDATEDLYDEFGNYIGPDLESDESDDDSSSGSSEDGGADDDASSAVSDLEEGNAQQSSDSAALVPHLDDDNDPDSIAPAAGQIVLHEDKVHYPSASTIYGSKVTTAVLDEDAMDIDTPILQPIQPPSHTTADVTYDPKRDENQIVSEEYLTNTILNNPNTTMGKRGVALVGHLNSGKTTLMDLLYRHTLVNHDQYYLAEDETQNLDDDAVASSSNTNGNKSNTQSSTCPRYYTDTLPLEQQRQLSLKSTPITLPLRTTHLKTKTYGITLMDTPGHTQFHDEAVASLRISDGAILTIDAIEGIMLHDEMLLKQCVREGIPIVLVLNKVDRLIVELKLPPEDAYCKLRSLVEGVNCLVRSVDKSGKYGRFCPSRGNVAFASGLHGWCFTLESMAEMYVDHVVEDDEDSDDDEDDVMGGMGAAGRFGRGVLGKNLPAEELAKRLWGDAYLCPKMKTFRKKVRDCIPISSDDDPIRRTFVQFVLEPLYKVYTACLGEVEKDVAKVLRSVGVFLSRDELRASPGVLLNAAFDKLFGNPSGLVDMIVKNIPSPAAASLGKVSRNYTGQIDSKIAKSMIKCNSNGPLMIHVTKLFANNDATGTGATFSAFGRIYSGSIRPGNKVKVLGEAYSPEDDEDVAFATVTSVSIPRGRFRTEVSIARAGNWVLLQGVDANISKTATITDVKGENGNGDDGEEVRIFKPLKFPEAGGESVMKLSVEPLNPAELPKMVEGLRRVSKSYPMVRTRVEESGEHVLFGTGELYLDCAMHDLRTVYSDIEVKVADPVVGFRETAVETSRLKCFAETANKRNKLTMIAEPLDDGLAEQLEMEKIKLSTWDNKKVGRYFQSKYDWDLLSARSVWAFGDSPTNGPNILLDDTLPSEVDKSLLNTTKSSIVQGFQWAMREGPLCEEPVRSTKLKLLDTVLADRPIHRGAGQIIPTARKVVHSSLMTATPRLMEPVYRLQIQCPGDIVDSIAPLLSKRRGHIVEDKSIPASQLYTLKAFIPVMDSFGFETDLRTYTQGQAMVHSVFDHWSVVPGDPLDRNIILHPLEPSPPQHLARDFLVKTRRRKGLSEDVSLTKFFDEGMRDQLDIVRNEF